MQGKRYVLVLSIVLCSCSIHGMDKEGGTPRVRDFRQRHIDLQEERPKMELAMLQEQLDYLATTLHAQLGKLKEEERAAALQRIVAAIEPDHQKQKDALLAPWLSTKVGFLSEFAADKAYAKGMRDAMVAAFIHVSTVRLGDRPAVDLSAVEQRVRAKLAAQASTAHSPGGAAGAAPQRGFQPPDVQLPWINRHPLVFGASTAAFATAGTAVATLLVLRH